jgi:hypothetical protein
MLQHFTVKKMYHEKLKNLPFDLYVYIIDKDGLDKIGKMYPEHQITREQFNKNQIYWAEDDKIVFDEIRQNMKSDPSGVHFIMGDNYSENNQVGPTPWILVHRFIHCVSTALGTGSINTALNRARIGNHQKVRRPHLKDYEASDVFTFKSAREKFHDTDEVSDDVELVAEIATHYYITGDIPVKIDDQVVKTAVKKIKVILDRHAERLKGKTFYV